MTPFPPALSFLSPASPASRLLRPSVSRSPGPWPQDNGLKPGHLTLEPWTPLHFGAASKIQALAAVAPSPQVEITPAFTQAVAHWLRLNPTALPHQLSQVLKTASWVLDDGGDQSHAMASMFLPQAIDSQNRQQLKTRLKGLPSEIVQPLTQVMETVSTAVGDFFHHETNTRVNNLFKARVVQLSPAVRRIMLGHLLAQLEVKSHQGSPNGPMISIADRQWLNELMAALTQAKKTTPLSRMILGNLQANRTLSNDAVRSAPSNGKPPAVLGQRFIDALEMAREIHQDQRRRDTNAPYLTHLLHVAATVLEMGGSEDAAIAALLHDAPEDQGGEEVLAKIALKFGPDVGRMVSECTILWEKDWLKERQAYLRNITPALHPETALIMLADKGHNLQSIVRSLTEKGASQWGHFARGKEEQLWFYRSARSALSYCLGENAYLKSLENSIHTAERLSYAPTDPIYRLLSQKQRAREEAQTLQAALKEIAETPTLQQLNKLTNSLPSTMPQETRIVDGKKVPAFSPERAARHEAMLAVEYEKFLAQRQKAPEGKGYKRAHIVTGPFGAGKSCFVTLPLAEQDCALNVDADVFKKQFPQEYHVAVDHPLAVGLDLKPNNGLGATAVHQESSYLTTRLFTRAMEQGDSFIMSYTGLDLDWDKRMITDLKARGYQVYVHHMQVSLKTSLNRMFHRYRTEGRYTPADILVKKSRSSTDNFIQLKDWGYKQGLIDGYSWYFNDIQEGTPPVLIESLSRTDEPFLPDTVHASCVLNA